MESLWLRVEVVWPLEALVWCCLVYSMRSHIYAWNMVGDDWLKEKFGSTQSMVGWYVEIPDLVGIYYVNKSYSSIMIHVYLSTMCW